MKEGEPLFNIRTSVLELQTKLWVNRDSEEGQKAQEFLAQLLARFPSNTEAEITGYKKPIPGSECNVLYEILISYGNSVTGIKN